MNGHVHRWKPVTFHRDIPAFQCETCRDWAHHGNCVSDGICQCGLGDFDEWESQFKRTTL